MAAEETANRGVSAAEETCGVGVNESSLSLGGHSVTFSENRLIAQNVKYNGYGGSTPTLNLGLRASHK